MFILYFDQFLEKKNKMAARPEVLRRKKKTKPDSCSKGPVHFEIFFFLILTYFDENPKRRLLDDVILETVNISGTGSNAIPYIPWHFNTSDRNFK